MSRLRSVPQQSLDAELDEAWPAIRARIDQAKIISLDSPLVSAPAPARRGGRAGRAAAYLAAAAVLAVGGGIVGVRIRRASPAVAASSPALPLQETSDSARLYRDEAVRLLDELEVERALLRPSTRETVDEDLRTIDHAISELESAIARDPNDPALRQLLASSYRQKVELLKRINNAG